MELNNERVTTPPRPAATVMLLRDSDAGLQVFMVQRHGQSDVLGGVHVFPGGKVDRSDHEDQSLARLDQPQQWLHQRLGESQIDERTAAATCLAACRETFEECGVLLADGADEALQRRALSLHRDGMGFTEMADALDLRIRVGALAPWTRWITPVIPSMMMRKRFDTRFFVIPLPEGQKAAHDNHEASDSLWISPKSGLQQYWAREVELAPPQIMSLAHLSRFSSVAEVMAEAQRRPPPVIQPEPHQIDGLRVVAYPGDPLHPVTSRAMPGPTRLIHREGRFEPFSGRFDDLFA